MSPKKTLAVTVRNGLRTRTRLNKAALDQELEKEAVDIPPSTPRKRKIKDVAIKSEEVVTQEDVKVKIESPSPSKKLKKIKTSVVKSETALITPSPSPRKKRVFVKVDPPADWEDTYHKLQKMRSPGGIAYPAAVDTMGCDVVHERVISEEERRLHCLVSLMLSSQTKDTQNAIAMNNLQTQMKGGLTLQGLLDIDEVSLNEMIKPVGFHNVKTKTLKRMAITLRDNFQGLTPTTLEDTMSLHGVGPKMAYLYLSSAIGTHLGIGVDTHVHRISGLLGFTQDAKTPEESRAQLESWLPKMYWKEINHLMVGFGQTICLPRGRKCNKCLLAETCPSSLADIEDVV